MGIGRRSAATSEEILREQANFEALEEAVKQFASDAPLAALGDILTSLDGHPRNGVVIAA